MERENICDIWGVIRSGIGFKASCVTPYTKNRDFYVEYNFLEAHFLYELKIIWLFFNSTFLISVISLCGHLIKITASIYLFKFHKRNIRMCEIRSKLIIKTTKRRRCRSGVFIVNSEKTSRITLLFPLLTIVDCFDRELPSWYK